MYKNFNITESEKEQILNRLKENGYGQPINEQKAPIKKPVAKQPAPNVPAPLKLDTGEVVKMPFLKNQQILNDFLTINSQDLEAVGIPASEWGKSTLKSADDAVAYQKEKFGSNVTPEEESKIRGRYFNTSYMTMMFGIFSSVLRWSAAFNFNGDDLSEANQNVFLQGIRQYDNSNWVDNGRKPADVLKVYFDNNMQHLTYQQLLDWCCDLIDYKIKKFGGDQTQQQPVQGQPTTTQPQKPLNEGQEILKDVFKSLIK
jgi:hypothetical protein